MTACPLPLLVSSRSREAPWPGSSCPGLLHTYVYFLATRFPTYACSYVFFCAWLSYLLLEENPSSSSSMTTWRTNIKEFNNSNRTRTGRHLIERRRQQLRTVGPRGPTRCIHFFFFNVIFLYFTQNERKRRNSSRQHSRQIRLCQLTHTNRRRVIVCAGTYIDV